MSKIPFVVMVAAVGALVPIGLQLGSTRRTPALALRGSERPLESARTAVAGGARPADPIAVQRELVAEAPAVREPSAPPPPTSRRAPAKVRGQVRGSRGPVADFDVSFRVAGSPAMKAADWDFTDEGGRFAVELVAGTYSVIGIDELPIATFDVPAGSEELLLNLFISDQELVPREPRSPDAERPARVR